MISRVLANHQELIHGPLFAPLTPTLLHSSLHQIQDYEINFQRNYLIFIFPDATKNQILREPKFCYFDYLSKDGDLKEIYSTIHETSRSGFSKIL